MASPATSATPPQKSFHILMLSNNCMLVSSGLLTLLDTEDELFGMLARETAHYVLDHAVITVNKNINRANRAAFW